MLFPLCTKVNLQKTKYGFEYSSRFENNYLYLILHINLFIFFSDIREIIHGLGEKRPRIDAVKTLQSVLVKQMALLIYQTQLAAYKNNSKIHIKHIIYVLKDYKYTIIRLLSYYCKNYY